jgi:hypothetical protein
VILSVRGEVSWRNIDAACAAGLPWVLVGVGPGNDDSLTTATNMQLPCQSRYTRGVSFVHVSHDIVRAC